MRRVQIFEKGEFEERNCVKVVGRVENVTIKILSIRIDILKGIVERDW